MNPYQRYMEKHAVNARLAGRIAGALAKQEQHLVATGQKAMVGFTPTAHYIQNGIGDAAKALHDRIYAVATSRIPGRGLQEAAMADLDARMLTGRHGANRHVYEAPTNFNEATGVTSGKGVHPDVAYRGVGGIHDGMDVSKLEAQYAPDRARWVTGMPQVAKDYIKHQPRGAKYVTVHDLRGLEGRSARSPWTPQIDVDPTSVENYGPHGSTRGFVNHVVGSGKVLSSPTYRVGNSPIYEKVIDHKDLAASEVSRMKLLPSGRGYQQVKGRFTPATHPMAKDYGYSHKELDVNGANPNASLSDHVGGLIAGFKARLVKK